MVCVLSRRLAVVFYTWVLLRDGYRRHQQQRTPYPHQHRQHQQQRQRTAPLRVPAVVATWVSLVCALWLLGLQLLPQVDSSSAQLEPEGAMLRRQRWWW